MKHRCPECGTMTAWTKDAVALLGTDHDEVIAKRLGYSLWSVSWKRRSLDIPLFADRRRRNKEASKFHHNRLRAMAEMRKTHTLEGIARKYGISRERVRQLLKQAGVPKPDPFPSKAWKLPKKYIPMLGVKLDKEIAMMTGKSGSAITKIRNAMGIEPASREGTKNIIYDHARVIKLYLAGNDGPRVAKLVGCSQPAVYVILKKHNIPRRPKGKRIAV